MMSGQEETLEAITPAQSKAGRALLGWSQADLAKRANVAVSTIADFERASRTPVSNNLDAIRTAFERDGISFGMGGAIVGPASGFAIASLVPTSELRPVRWIDETTLNSWAERISAREEFPDLLRRLMLARFGFRGEMRFPASGAIQLRGWDAQTNFPASDALLPVGPAGWELGTNEGIRTKAESDYRSRATATDGNQSKLTFVFATPRYWGAKDEWRDEKLKEGTFKDVRVLDGVDICHLLDQTPAVALWLAQRIGRVPSGVRLLEDAWKEWAFSTELPLTEDLILTARDDQSTAIHRWINGAPSSISIQAESTSEAIAFLSASLAEYGREVADAIASRVLIVGSEEIAREIANVPVPLIVVLSEIDPGVSGLLLSKGHHVYLAYGSSLAAPADVNVLPRIPGHSLAEGLKALLPKGHDRRTEERFGRLARDAGGSLTVLRRLMDSAPGLLAPVWAHSAQARAYLPLLLLGGWNDDNEHDRRVVEKISGASYRDVQASLTVGLTLAESPVRHIGSMWKIASPRDAWFRLARFLTPIDIEEFESVAREVLASANPEFEDSDDWFKPRRLASFSSFLKQGIVETLILLGVFGRHVAVRNLEHTARSIVRDTLRQADSALWVSLAEYLQELAEAAPEEFLSAIEESLDSNEQAVMGLFKSDGEGLFGSRSHQSQLLWALELLAWSKDYLPRVTRILLRLTELDPKQDNYANRPNRSLRHIYLPWFPQTNATLAERFDVLGSFRQEFPDTMWEIILDLYPKGHDSASHNPMPRWRSFDTEVPEVVTNRSIWNAEKTLADWIAEGIGNDVDRWIQIIGRLTDLSPSLRAQIAKQLMPVAKKAKGERRAKLRAALRNELHRNRQFVEAGWSMPESELAPFEAAHNVLQDDDPVERFGWLFENFHAPLLNPAGTDFRANEKASRDARTAAIMEMVDAKGWGFVRYFAAAKSSINARLVGVAVADAGGKEVADGLWSMLLGAGDEIGQNIAAGMIDTLCRSGVTTLTASLLDRGTKEKWPESSLATVMLWLPKNDELYRRLETSSESVRDRFWKFVWPHDLDIQSRGLDWVVRSLVAYDRAYTAAELMHQHLSSVSASLIIEVLESLLKDQSFATKSGNDAVMLQYYVEHMFLHLDKDTTLDTERLGRLEWQFLNVLESSSRPPRMLHRQLAASPEFFAELISLIYRKADAEPVEEPDPDVRARTIELATHAYTLLRTWHMLPGQDGEAVDSRVLMSWVDKARTLCESSGRGSIADEKIGELFAFSPSDADGLWPCLAVRGVIERLRNDRLETGLYIGTRNKRGVTSRGVFDGGDLERQEVAHYRGLSAKLRTKWPRTASVLERLARSYEAEAQGHDDEAAMRDL